MAVPKKKTSYSRKGLRRSHLRLKTHNGATCPSCGEITLAHRVCTCGNYKGQEVFTPRENAK